MHGFVSSILDRHDETMRTVSFDVLSWGPLTARRSPPFSTTASKQRPNNGQTTSINDQTTTKQRPNNVQQRPNNDQKTTKPQPNKRGSTSVGVGLQVKPGTTNLAFHYKTSARKVDKHSTLSTAPARSVINLGAISWEPPLVIRVIIF